MEYAVLARGPGHGRRCQRHARRTGASDQRLPVQQGDQRLRSAQPAQRPSQSARAHVDEDGQPVQVWAEDLVEVAEAAASCPVFPLLKRPDERHVTMRAHDRPVFVEDMVRAAAEALGADRADRVVQRGGRQRGEHPQPPRVCSHRVRVSSGRLALVEHAGLLVSTAPAECPIGRGPCMWSSPAPTGRPGPSLPSCTWAASQAAVCAGRAGNGSGDSADIQAVSPLIPAEDLYAGEHWLVARGLPDSEAARPDPAMGVLGGLWPDPRKALGPPVRGYF